MSLDEGFYFQGDMKSFQRYEPNLETEAEKLPASSGNKLIIQTDRKGDIEYNKALQAGLFDENSYWCEFLGRGTLKCVTPPLVKCFAIELRV
jgi:hypothetical protein